MTSAHPAIALILRRAEYFNFIMTLNDIGNTSDRLEKIKKHIDHYEKREPNRRRIIMPVRFLFYISVGFMGMNIDYTHKKIYNKFNMP